MTKKKTLRDDSIVDDVHDFFEQNQNLTLRDLDVSLILKLIISSLDQCVQDSKGNGPRFMATHDFIHMEIENKKFSIAIKDNSLYS